MIRDRALLNHIVIENTGGQWSTGQSLMQRIAWVAKSLLGPVGRFVWLDRRKRPVAGRGPDQRGIVTVSEVDYFGLAHTLIDHYGTGAKAQAGRLMQEALREADQEAATDWRIVGQAIALLTSKSDGSLRH